MEDEISYTLYIAENRRNKCPRILINIAGEEIFAVIDTGCEMSIFSEHLYNRLRHVGLDCLELPTQHINLVSAFNNKSRRVRKQALLEFSIGNTKVDQIVLLSSQLLTDAILGIDFLISYEAEISFLGRSITLRINGESYKIKFIA